MHTHLLLDPEVGDLEAVLQRDGRLPAELGQDQGIVGVAATDTLHEQRVSRDRVVRHSVASRLKPHR